MNSPAKTFSLHCFRWKRVVLGTAALVIACASLGSCHGCSQWIAHAIVDAPNAKRSLGAVTGTPTADLTSIGVSQELRVDVGPPDASLSIWIIDPAAASSADGIMPKPRGTVLVLHGIRDGKRSQIALGKQLAAAGYRAVLVDLRGHGQSTGQWLTYGVVESRDLVQTLDALERQCVVQGAIGVIGASYGGAVGIQLAAIDPRVRAVVAIAPFSSLSEIIPEYLAQSGFGWAVTERTLADGMQQAGELASFDPSQASPINAIAKTNTRVLLIHGENDQHIRCDHSRRLHDAALDHSELIVLPDEDHVTVMQDRSGVILRESLELFERRLTPPASSQ